jgi:hypothetical protein
MAKKILFPGALLCAAGIAMLAGLYACYTYRTATPDELAESMSQAVEEIVVVKMDGTKERFVNGWLDAEKFTGVTRSHDLVEIDRKDISHFELKIFNRTGTVGLAGGLFAGVMAIAAAVSIPATIISCPQVYSFDGAAYTLDAEPLSGAVVRSARRVDYSVLRAIAPVDGAYTIRYIDGANEVDFTDELKLAVVDHDPEIEVLPDAAGRLVAVGEVQAPVYARSHTGEDLMKRPGKAGELFWEGDPYKPYADPSRPREELHLKFKRPSGATRARLIVGGQNTLWGYHILEEFLGKFGGSARKKLEKLDKDPQGKEKVEGFMKKNGVWIEVLVLDGGAWKPAGHVPEVGPMVPRTQALDITLPPGAGDVVELKLRWAPLSWTIMRLGIDFSCEDADFTVTEVAASSALDESRGDIAALVALPDGVYYRAEKGDGAVITFPEPPAVPGSKRTIFLKTTGYYNLVLPEDKEGSLMEKMNLILKKKGIDAYSLEKFKETVK